MDALAPLLPFAILLLCPLMMLFMHGSHGHSSDRSHAQHHTPSTEHEELAQRVPSLKEDAKT